MVPILVPLRHAPVPHGAKDTWNRLGNTHEVINVPTPTQITRVGKNVNINS